MKKGILILLSLALIVPAGLFAQAGPPGGGHGQRGHPGFHGQSGCQGFDGPGSHHGQMGHRDRMHGLLALADELELTQEQKDQLKEFRLDFKLKNVDRKAELEKAEIMLRKLMMDDDASESQVMRAIDEVSRLKADIHKARYTQRQAMKSVLTDEQQERVKELRMERRGDRQDFQKPDRRQKKRPGRGFGG